MDVEASCAACNLEARMLTAAALAEDAPPAEAPATEALAAGAREELVKDIFFFSVLGREAVQQKNIFYLLLPKQSNYFLFRPSGGSCKQSHAKALSTRRGDAGAAVPL